MKLNSASVQNNLLPQIQQESSEESKYDALVILKEHYASWRIAPLPSTWTFGGLHVYPHPAQTEHYLPLLNWVP